MPLPPGLPPVIPNRRPHRSTTPRAPVDVIDLTLDDEPDGEHHHVQPQPGQLRDARVSRIRTPTPGSANQRPRVHILLISIILFIIARMAQGSDWNVTDFVNPHQSRLEMESVGKVIFAPTSAVLHLEFDALGLYQHVQDTLTAFHNSSHLFNGPQNADFPFLQGMLYQEFTAVTEANAEFKNILDLIGFNKPERSPRSAGWIGLGLSVLNAGWSSYLTMQSLHSNAKTDHLVHSVGQLQRAVLLQQKQTTTLAQAIYALQETTLTTTDTLSALQILQSLKSQIKTTTRELHAGIHQHRIPVSLFHPDDIKNSWKQFNDFIKASNLVPIFNNWPSQLYEFKADYFQINGSVHILAKIPVRGEQNNEYDLQKSKPALLRLKNTLMYYEDPDLLAVPHSPVNNPVSVSMTPEELKDCEVLGTIFCCQKQVFPHKRTSCADELISGLPYPSDQCLSKFKILDPNQRT